MHKRYDDMKPMTGIRVGKPVVVGDVTIIPLVNVHIQSVAQAGRYWFHGSADPFAVVVVSQGVVSAVDIETGEFPIDELMTKVPDLSAVIQSSQDARS